MNLLAPDFKDLINRKVHHHLAEYRTLINYINYINDKIHNNERPNRITL